MVDLYESNPHGEVERKQILSYVDQKLRELDEKIAELFMLKEEILSYKERWLKETK